MKTAGRKWSSGLLPRRVYIMCDSELGCQQSTEYSIPIRINRGCTLCKEESFACAFEHKQACVCSFYYRVQTIYGVLVTDQPCSGVLDQGSPTLATGMISQRSHQELPLSQQEFALHSFFYTCVRRHSSLIKRISRGVASRL